MLTRQDLIASMTHECRVAKHLYRKLPPDALDYRPTPGQRSTLELLRYLSYVGAAMTDYLLTGKDSAYERRHKAAQTLKAKDFPKAMDRQARDLKALLGRIPEKNFATRTVALPWGRKGKLGPMLVETSLKWLVGYRMQLFLYAKAAGAGKLGTADCWIGKSSAQRRRS